LTKLAGTPDHQGMVGYAAPFVYVNSVCDPKKYRRLLLLDGIQDPRNMGAIIRSAYCTGFDALIITRKASAPISGAVLKASAGLAEHCAIMQVPTINAAQHLLKKAGYNLYLAVLDPRAVSALEVEYRDPLCLVIGNEETGISSDMYQAGTLITLSQKRADISYNASVAAGILLFVIQNKK
jgi:23S rRNA (guanosine2251-2'-O)-methyltransferase